MRNLFDAQGIETSARPARRLTPEKQAAIVSRSYHHLRSRKLRQPRRAACYEQLSWIAPERQKVEA